MHEVGIAQNILQIAEGAARLNGLTAITEIEVEIGPLAGVNTDALTFAFEIVRQSTLAASAALVTTTPPLLLRCRRCAAEYPAEMDELDCPVCGEPQFEVLQGGEMRVCSISGEPESQPKEA